MHSKTWIKLSAFAVLACLTFLQVNTVEASGPDQTPVLRIETNTHINLIRRVSVDEKCSIAASVSDDKTIRLWSLDQGQPLKVLRGPIGKGHEGKLFSVAVSPDGTLIAVAGWDPQFAEDQKMRVYIFDAQSGQIIKRIGSASTVYNHLEFSKDGQYLGAVLGDSQGMTIWSTRNWQEVASDKNYNGHNFGATFGPDNAFYTTSSDGFLRKYAPNGFRLLKKTPYKNGKVAYGISVDPTGKYIAIGMYDKPVVDVYNAADLTYAFAPNRTGINKDDLNFQAVAWSGDGTSLYAGGAYQDARSQTRAIRVWQNSGRGPGINVAGTKAPIMSLASCRDKLILGSMDPVLGVFDDALKNKLFWQDPATVDMRGKMYENFTISPTGKSLRFGLGIGGTDPVLFDLESGSIVDAPGAFASMVEADIKSLKIENWDESSQPVFNGRPLKLDENEQSFALAIHPQKTTFMLGTTGALRAYDRTGEPLWRFDAPSYVGGINITRNGQLVIATYGDGTIRWHRASDGKELLALFVHAKDRRWIAWTPKGYYMASAGGEDLIGWHINRGWDQTADFFPSSRFRDTFYRPDIVKQTLNLLDEEFAISEANRTAQRKENDSDISKRLPPIINIVSAGDSGYFSDASVNLTYSIRSPSGLDITKVDVFIDGRPADKAVLENFAIPQEGQQGRLTLKLPPRDISISLVAHTKQSASEAARVALVWKGQVAQQQQTTSFGPGGNGQGGNSGSGTGAASGGDINKPKLYALLIGVSDYKNPEYKLNYAAKDAEDFAKTLKSQEGGMYREVVIKTLTNSNATTQSIREGLSWLEGEVTSRDVGILFLAGHGMNDTKQRFYYLPYEGEADKLLSTAIPQSDIQNVISGLAGKALMFVDACHSAGSFGATTQTRGLSLVDINGVVNELSSAENGVVMFASSTGRQLSMEDSRWQNGAFTKALLEGFSGKADYNKNSAISISELDLWLSERVKELTEKRQHPVARRPPTVPDFPIAIPQ